MEILVKTLAGLEEILAQELADLGAQEITPLKRAVKCTGDHRVLYASNLWLRTALRVLVPVHTFTANTEQELYDGMKNVNWGQFMKLHQTFVVDVVTQSARLNHSHFLSLKTKDAIADWFREKSGKRPGVNVDRPDVRFHVHIDSRNIVTLLLDSSGDGLHRRGYRTDGGEAPLNEVLAAGLVLLSGWKADRPLVDMMCGSGTILIEAGMIATRRPPGMNRKFAFEQWPDFDTALWKKIKDEARAMRRPFALPIIGVDVSPRAVRIAEQNISAAHLDDTVRVRRSPFQKYLPPEGPAFLISNPPYGLRIKTEELVGLYREIGDKLKKDFADYDAWIFSGNIDALKQVGLKPSRKLHLMNGQLECRFFRYELYAGTKGRDKNKLFNF
ncbi:MAG: class I SAM-dependent RNA methyltransferase [Saprospiraceae bacterium]